ncbi:MAG: hypothetical protein WDM77_08280 [Steroidobacteraceae bacterium]
MASSRVAILNAALIERRHKFLGLDESQDALTFAVNRLGRIPATAALTGRHFHPAPP